MLAQLWAWAKTILSAWMGPHPAIVQNADGDVVDDDDEEGDDDDGDVDDDEDDGDDVDNLKDTAVDMSF